MVWVVTHLLLSVKVQWPDRDQKVIVLSLMPMGIDKKSRLWILRPSTKHDDVDAKFCPR